MYDIICRVLPCALLMDNWCSNDPLLLRHSGHRVHSRSLACQLLTTRWERIVSYPMAHLCLFLATPG